MQSHITYSVVAHTRFDESGFSGARLLGRSASHGSLDSALTCPRAPALQAWPSLVFGLVGLAFDLAAFFYLRSDPRESSRNALAHGRHASMVGNVA